MGGFSQHFLQKDYAKESVIDSVHGCAVSQAGKASTTTFAIGEDDASGLLSSSLADAQRRVDQHLRSLLRSQQAAGRPLFDAMRAGLLDGGKRVRPFLLFASAEFAQGLTQKPKRGFGNNDNVRRLTDDAAAALELVHSYSLIHDDLPAMDGDLLRRGKPTVHVRFGEGQAILAGDALLTLAFEILAAMPTFYSGGNEPRLRVALINRLAVAAGARGMVGGQSWDLDYADKSSGKDGGKAKNSRADVHRVRLIHARKTGALLRAACAMGGCCVAANGEVCEALEDYGQAIGVAYQIIDDLCDFSNVGEVGSSSPCYVRSVGKLAAEHRARALCKRAEKALVTFGAGASVLGLFARYLPSRIPG